MPTDPPSLVLFCKRPRLHHGKQRLAAAIGAEPAFAAAEALLACALEDAAGWPGPVVLAPSRQEDAEWAGELMQAATVRVQPDGNLGDRLNHVDRELRAAGRDALLFMGSDAPALTEDCFTKARAGLERHDVVLARAADGGVTLMGNAKPWPDLASLPWSTPELAEALQAACEEAGLSVLSFAGGYDVDVAADLPPLALGLSSDRRPARRRLAALLATLNLS